MKKAGLFETQQISVPVFLVDFVRRCGELLVCMGLIFAWKTLLFYLFCIEPLGLCTYMVRDWYYPTMMLNPLGAILYYGPVIALLCRMVRRAPLRKWSDWPVWAAALAACAGVMVLLMGTWWGRWTFRGEEIEGFGRMFDVYDWHAFLLLYIAFVLFFWVYDRRKAAKQKKTAASD